MNRRQVIPLLSLSLIGGYLYQRFGFMKETKTTNQKMPIVFIGHGSPMNAIESNVYTEMQKQLGKNLPKPKAILVISAHWMTKGSWVTGMEKPKTIHDFYGFPKELFEQQYPAPGDPGLANNLHQKIQNPSIIIDHNEWGLDHGTWSVLTHMFPDANIPVVQLSLDMSKPPEYHFELGKQISYLREQGILIIGSGNIVHNLRTMNWKKDAAALDWAEQFDNWVKEKLNERDFNALVYDSLKSSEGKLSIPSLDHYLPLLYVLGAASKSEEITFEVEGIQHGSISMQSFRFS